MNGMGLLTGLGIAIVLGGLWARFVRIRQPKETIVIIGWSLILALVLVAYFLDLYLPAT